MKVAQGRDGDFVAAALVGVIKNKEKLIYLPIIYTIISTILVFASYEVHVGTDFEKGYEKPAIAQVVQIGAIAFILAFIIIMLSNYVKLQAEVPKKRALYYAIGSILTLVGLILVNVGHQTESSPIFTFSWFLFLCGGLGFYLGQNIK